MREYLMKGLDKIIATKFAIIKVALLVLIFATGLPWNCHADIPAVERQALIALYNSTDGDNWANNSGWKDGPLDVDGFAMPGTENTWFGITCDGDNTNVRYINLHANGLTGNIPSEIGNLSNLSAIWLSSNGLTGRIPSHLGNLTNLVNIELFSNRLTGIIPSELGNLSNLERLILGDNELSGSIPPELGSLSSIQALVIYDNQLTGSIPSELGDLSSLEFLNLGDNKLTGSIPSKIGNLSNLQTLWLSNNQLTGSIPSELGNLSKLKNLYLSGNQFEGSIPTSFINLTNLISTSTDIGYNALYTIDDTLRAFLNSKDPDWENTQTVAPENVTTAVASDTSIEVSWTPIAYTADSGGYRVFYSTNPGGPYDLFGTTADKTVSQMEVTGLNPNTTYYFVVQTRTDPHVNNQNAVYSEYSEEVSAISAPNTSFGMAGLVPDTGQTQSYTDTFGEDSDYNINPPSYTKLDAEGNDLTDSASEWVMVRDNVTGLIWEEKTDDGSIHDKDNKYTWYDSNPETNGGNAGTPGDGTDTEDFINALNSANFGGFNDWRLPTIKELSSIVNSGVYGPAIATAYFPNTMWSGYWSSTTNANYTVCAWLVPFYYGNVSYNNKSDTYYVRAVRGGQ